MPRTLTDLLETLDQANSDLTEFSEDIPADSPTFARLENAIKILVEVAKEAEDAAADRCETCESNPCICYEEDEDDE